MDYDRHFSTRITKIDINSCFLKDEGFAQILEGLNETEIILSVTYQNDEFGVKSAEQLVRLLERCPSTSIKKC